MDVLFEPDMEIYNSDDKSEMQKFFADQTIFVTGGTGFLGKLLIEKLLRACYDLKKIYVLVRMKKGKIESERFKEIFDADCFKVLKKLHPNFLEKVALIYGDCLKPNLGLSEESRKILVEEVTSVFHVAATVRFDQHLRSAFYINVRSVRDLIKMAKEMKQLKAFIHVSTAYSNCPREEIAEKFYPPSITSENLSKLLNSLDDKTITEITPILLKDWPNSYVYTKAIGESVVAEDGFGLPIAMIRPAIVTASAKEPFAGWIDNIYGVNGVVAGAGLGILRTMPADPNNNAELVPVDFVINSTIAAAWYLSKLNKKPEKEYQIPIYNYVLSPWQDLTWGKFFDICYTQGIDYPSSRAIWHFCFALRPNPIMHELAVFFLHTIPAYIMDFLLLCLGRKRMAVQGYKKVRKFLDVIAYFAKRNWQFHDENVRHLLSEMSEKDRQIFDFDLGKQNMCSVIQNGIIGGRIYIAQDPLDTLPAARKKYFKLKIAHYVLCSLLLYLFFKIVMFVFSFMF